MSKPGDVYTSRSLVLFRAKEEAKQHAKIWEAHGNHYQRIRWDGSLIQSNLELVLHGKEPKPLTYPKPEPLRLWQQTRGHI